MAEDDLNSLPIPDFDWEEYEKKKIFGEKVITAPTVSSVSGMIQSASSEFMSNCTIKNLLSKDRDDVLMHKNLSKKSTPTLVKSSLEEILADMYLKDPSLNENKMINKNFVTCDYLEKLVEKLNLSYLHLKMYPEVIFIAICKPNLAKSIEEYKIHKSDENCKEILNSVANKEIPTNLFCIFKNPHDVLLHNNYVILKTEEFTPVSNFYTFKLLKPISEYIECIIKEKMRRENFKKADKRKIEPELCVEMSGPLYLDANETSTLNLINLFSCPKISEKTNSTSLETVSNRNLAADHFIEKSEIIQEWMERTFNHISSSSDEVKLGEYFNLKGQPFFSISNVENSFKSLLISRNINKEYCVSSNRQLNMKLAEIFSFNLIFIQNTTAEKEYTQYNLLIFFKNGLFYVYCTEKTENIVHIDDFFQCSNIHMVHVGNRTELDKYIFNFARLISENFNVHLIIKRQEKFENNAEGKKVLELKEVFCIINKRMYITFKPGDTNEMERCPKGKFLPVLSNYDEEGNYEAFKKYIHLDQEEFSSVEESVQSSDSNSPYNGETTPCVEDISTENMDSSETIDPSVTEDRLSSSNSSESVEQFSPDENAMHSSEYFAACVESTSTQYIPSEESTKNPNYETISDPENDNQVLEEHSQLEQPSGSFSLIDVQTTSGFKCDVAGIEDISNDESTSDKSKLENVNGAYEKKTESRCDVEGDYKVLQEDIHLDETEPSEPFIYVSSVFKDGSVKTVFEAHQFEEKENTTQIQLLKDSEKEQIEVYRCLHKEFCYNPKEPEDPTLFNAPPAPTSVLEALNQRLENFQSSKKDAETEGNSSKVRRLDRIIKSYDKAIKDYKAGKHIDFGKLPAPPGTDDPSPSYLYFDYNFGEKELESLNNHLKIVCNVFKPRSIRKGSTMPGLPISSAK